MEKYKIGNWCKDQAITKKWSKSEFLINNQEIYFDKSNIDVLTPFTTRYSIMPKILLYAMFDLYENEPNKNYFNQNEILNQMGEIREFNENGKNSKKRIVKSIYKIKINQKVQELIKQKNQKSFINSNKCFDLEKKNRTEIQKNIQKLIKIRSIGMGDFYNSIERLHPIFIGKKQYIRKKDYQEFQNIINKQSSKLYYLNKDGKELMRKIKEENYLL